MAKNAPAANTGNNTENTSGAAAPVTPATGTSEKTAKPRTAPELTAVHTIPIPQAVKTARGSKSPYPFDTLDVGQAFGAKNKTAKQLSSIVSNQNRKDSNHRKRTDANGNVIYKMTEMKDEQGNVTKVPTSEAETEQIKEFRAFDVPGNADLEKSIKGTPLEGSSVLVFRVK